ncbi:MAG: flagellar motor switch protein FliN [Terriglobales bacterium]|jgi:flagellar motor switch protein FliN
MSRNPIDLFVAALPTAATQAFSAKTSAAWSVALDEKPKPSPAGAQLLTMLLVAEPSKAEAAIQISLENTLALAAALGGAAALPTQFQPEHAQAVRALLAEACEKASQALQGTKIKLQLAKALPWTPARQFSFTGTDGGSRNIQFQLLFATEWASDAAAADAQSPRPEKGANVSLLENVEIDVTLRFGERRLPLREIGELRSGSVIELDKSLQEPAELLLGDRVVARGEVVIVDGNYGMRVTEVV